MKNIFQKTVLLITIAILNSIAIGQAPQKMSYQAVMRDASDNLLTNTTVGLQVSVLESSAQGTAVFVETHAAMTNANGLVSLEIGGGAVASGDFSTIDWGANSYFIKTEIDPNGGTNYAIEGTSQLLSVPYALYADVSGSAPAGPQGPQGPQGPVSATIAGTNILVSGSGTVADPYVIEAVMNEVDGDITNEIQDLQLSGNDLTITNNGAATTIDLSPYLDNTDTQLTEAEVDAYVGNNGYLLNEVDGDITNEIQDLQLSGNDLTITNNGTATTIDLSPYLDNTDTQLTEAEVDAYVGNNGYLLNEVDGDITNEIQTLSRNGDSISLSNGGNTISILDGDTTHWKENANGIHYEGGRVAIGNFNPNFPLHLYEDVSITNYSTLISAYGYGGNINGSFYSAINATSDATNGTNRGIEGVATGNNPASNQGIAGFAQVTSNELTGVLGVANGSGNFSFGVRGISLGDSLLSIGVEGEANSVGTYNVGLRGFGTGAGDGSAFSENYGVMGIANSNSAGSNYAVYGSASGTTVNDFAGYFDGSVTITGDLNVTGNIAKGGGTFKIDHPLDPANKYLVHSFVESPEMLNVYSGNAITGEDNEIVVALPDYFEASNKDYRYQLTVIGSFAQAIIKEEIEGNSFVIATSEPNVKVSWEVTAVRADKYADAYRIEPEQPKVEAGTYLHPYLYGVDKEFGVNYKHQNSGAFEQSDNKESLKPNSTK